MLLITVVVFIIILIKRRPPSTATSQQSQPTIDSELVDMLPNDPNAPIIRGSQRSLLSQAEDDDPLRSLPRTSDPLMGIFNNFLLF